MSTGTIVGELSAGSLTPLVFKVGDVSSSERVTLRCDFCNLRQYQTATNLCRRCHKPLPSADDLVCIVLSAVEAALAYKEPTVEKPTAMGVQRTTINLGGALREIRRMRHLSQRQLAAKMRVPRTYISKVENGKNIPKQKARERFAETLRVNPFDLFLLTSSDPVEVVRAYDMIFLEEFVIRKMPILYADREAILAVLAKRFPSVDLAKTVR
jgi:transcriptional regulator with XRE-family HTH domain